MRVFVVYYQNYIYADPECYGESEIKYLLNENFYVKGVFTTKQKAEEFIDIDAQDHEDSIEHYKTWHYFIDDFELDENRL